MHFIYTCFSNILGIFSIQMDTNSQTYWSWPASEETVDSVNQELSRGAKRPRHQAVAQIHSKTLSL